MSALKTWWQGLEPRERWVLGGGAVALIVMFYVFGIWLPGHRGVDRLNAQVAGQRASLSWMQQASGEVQALRSGGGATSALGEQSLFSLVDQSARQGGLGGAIRDLQPSGERRVRVTLDEASFDALVNWLATLKAQHGIEAISLTVRAGQGAGRVSAQLELEGAEA